MIDLKRVLKLVNEAREAMGLKTIAELPRGECGDGARCALARALGVPVVIHDDKTALFRHSVDGMMAAMVWGMGAGDIPRVTLPRELAQFVDAFDEGWCWTK